MFTGTWPVSPWAGVSALQMLLATLSPAVAALSVPECLLWTTQITTLLHHSNLSVVLQCTLILQDSNTHYCNILITRYFLEYCRFFPHDNCIAELVQWLQCHILGEDPQIYTSSVLIYHWRWEIVHDRREEVVLSLARAPHSFLNNSHLTD